MFRRHDRSSRLLSLLLMLLLLLLLMMMMRLVDLDAENKCRSLDCYKDLF